MKPYSDETMVFDEEERIYILTPKYLQDKTGINLTKVLNPGFCEEPQKLAEYFLEQISNELYGWIYQFNGNNEAQQYLLENSEFLRKTIRRAMIEQVMYVIKNGDLNLYSGVNVKNGQIIDQKLLVQAGISPNANRELNKIIPGVGVAITYQGQWNLPLLIGRC